MVESGGLGLKTTANGCVWFPRCVSDKDTDLERMLEVCGLSWGLENMCFPLMGFSAGMG
jgi:hypothetical protein